MKLTTKLKSNEIKLIRNYKSSHSSIHHDYLLELVKQIKKSPDKNGFWDNTSNNWIRQLNWNGSDWSGYMGHDWRYSPSCEEGALYCAIELSDNALNTQIKGELDYIHKQVNGDGSINDLPTTEKADYGIILSVLALGYIYFDSLDEKIAKQCYDDMKSVYKYVKLIGETPSKDSHYSMILRGYANVWKAHKQHKDTTKVNEVKNLIEKYATNFITNQGADGSWNVNGKNTIQTQLKRDIAILLAYDVILNSSYLDRVNDNVSWILANRWDSKTGGVKWTRTDPNFFECHQIWFMIVLRYLSDKSKGLYDYNKQIEEAWKFLTDNNYAGIDMYVDNYKKHGAFFSYRVINNNGNHSRLGGLINKFISYSDKFGGLINKFSSYNGIFGRIVNNIFSSKSSNNVYVQSQPYGDFKGSYEIGTALWGLALNYHALHIIKNKT